MFCCAIVMLLPLVLRAQEPSLAPARAGLRAVPLPALDLVEPPVAEQLRSAEREVVGKAVAEAPSSTVARTNLSGVLLQLSEYDAAIEQFEAVPSRC